MVGGRAPQARASESLLVGWVPGWGFHCEVICVHGLAFQGHCFPWLSQLGSVLPSQLTFLEYFAWVLLLE